MQLNAPWINGGRIKAGTYGQQVDVRGEPSAIELLALLQYVSAIEKNTTQSCTRARTFKYRLEESSPKSSPDLVIRLWRGDNAVS